MVLLSTENPSHHNEGRARAIKQREKFAQIKENYGKANVCACMLFDLSHLVEHSSTSSIWLPNLAHQIRSWQYIGQQRTCTSVKKPERFCTTKGYPLEQWTLRRMAWEWVRANHKPNSVPQWSCNQRGGNHLSRVMVISIAMLLYSTALEIDAKSWSSVKPWVLFHSHRVESLFWIDSQTVNLPDG